MQVRIKGEFLGSLQETSKGTGFIRQFLCLDPVGNKCVIKLYSKNAADLTENGERIVETDDFCFVPKR
jgi:hypothetical protein